jgi:hypothetical protein
VAIEQEASKNCSNMGPALRAHTRSKNSRDAKGVGVTTRTCATHTQHRIYLYSISRVFLYAVMSRLLLLVLVVLSDVCLSDHEPQGVETYHHHHATTASVDMPSQELGIEKHTQMRGYDVWYPLQAFVKWDSTYYLNLAHNASISASTPTPMGIMGAAGFDSNSSSSSRESGDTNTSSHYRVHYRVFFPLYPYIIRQVNQWVVHPIYKFVTKICTDSMSSGISRGAHTAQHSTLVLSALLVNVIAYNVAAVVLYVSLRYELWGEWVRSDERIGDGSTSRQHHLQERYQHKQYIQTCMFVFFLSPANVFTVTCYTECLYMCLTWST